MPTTKASFSLPSMHTFLKVPFPKNPVPYFKHAIYHLPLNHP